MTVHPRPRALERPSQRPRIVPSGEGTSSGVPPVGGSVPATRAAASQIMGGRLISVPDLLTWCWMPPGELSHQFLTLDTILEPVYDPVACTHVSFLSLLPCILIG